MDVALLHPVLRIDPRRIYLASSRTPFPLPPALWCLKHGKPRVRGPHRDAVIVLLGLAPWTLYPRCDICSNVPAYLARVGLSDQTPVIIYGRYAAHALCYDTNQDLDTMKLPALDYQALGALRPWQALVAMRARLGRMEDDADDH